MQCKERGRMKKVADMMSIESFMCVFDAWVLTSVLVELKIKARPLFNMRQNLRKEKLLIGLITVIGKECALCIRVHTGKAFSKHLHTLTLLWLL